MYYIWLCSGCCWKSLILMTCRNEDSHTCLNFHVHVSVYEVWMWISLSMDVVMMSSGVNDYGNSSLFGSMYGCLGAELWRWGMVIHGSGVGSLDVRVQYGSDTIFDWARSVLTAEVNSKRKETGLVYASVMNDVLLYMDSPHVLFPFQIPEASRFPTRSLFLVFYLESLPLVHHHRSSFCAYIPSSSPASRVRFYHPDESNSPSCLVCCCLVEQLVVP